MTSVASFDRPTGYVAVVETDGYISGSCRRVGGDLDRPELRRRSRRSNYRGPRGCEQEHACCRQSKLQQSRWIRCRRYQGTGYRRERSRLTIGGLVAEVALFLAYRPSLVESRRKDARRKVRGRPRVCKARFCTPPRREHHSRGDEHCKSSFAHRVRPSSPRQAPSDGRSSRRATRCDPPPPVSIGPRRPGAPVEKRSLCRD